MSEFYIGVLIGIAGTLVSSAVCLGLMILMTSAGVPRIETRFENRR